jgi:hypothetical protein
VTATTHAANNNVFSIRSGISGAARTADQAAQKRTDYRTLY